MRNLIFQLSRSAIGHVLMLISFCAVLYFPYLDAVPFFDKGEPREALAVQDILQRGEWLVPLKRATDIPSKPPLFHWSAALVTKATGTLNEATIRFPSVLYAILGVLVIYGLGRKMFDGKTALLGAAILATMTVYQDQALSARVDMTLCFIVTLSLTLFYLLYRGYLKNSLWYYFFYLTVGIGTLAKGPVGIVVTGLVAASLALVERRWDQIRKFCFHPGVVLTLVLAPAWYLIAVTRGGEGFFDRQILQENLSRFVGGSGHSHPAYYYIPYLFTQSMLWGLCLPVLFWDLFRKGIRADGDRLFLKLWFVVMFAFFSISVGKRPVYLLPLYPALALLLADWFYHAANPGRGKLAIYRSIAVFAGITSAVFLTISLGAVWSHDPGWLFGPIESLLKPKDRANVLAVRRQLENLGWTFTAVALVIAVLWVSLARTLWHGKMRSVAHQLVVVSLLHGGVGWSMIQPVIARGKSYAGFMADVNQRVKPDDRLYLYGRFNSDPVVYYRGSAIEKLSQPIEELAPKVGRGGDYLITPERTLSAIEKTAGTAPAPLIKSEGRGPEGDAPLVLLPVDLR